MNRSWTMAALVALLLSLPCIALGKGKLQKAEKNLERIENELLSLTLQCNHLTWQYYIENREQAKAEIPASYLDVKHIAKLCDTVPALLPFQKEYDRAYDAWLAIVRTDPEYEAIAQEKASLRGIRDSKFNNENKRRYNALYDRLRANNAEYPAVNESLNAARRIRNNAVAGYLLDRCIRQSVKMPELPSFSDDAMKTVLRDHPEIDAMKERIKIMKRLRNELQEQIFREEYDVPDTSSGKTSKPFGYAGSADGLNTVK